MTGMNTSTLIVDNNNEIQRSSSDKLIINGNMSCTPLPCIPGGTALDIAVLVDVSRALTDDYVQQVSSTRTFKRIAKICIKTQLNQNIICRNF